MEWMFVMRAVCSPTERVLMALREVWKSGWMYIGEMCVAMRVCAAFKALEGRPPLYGMPESPAMAMRTAISRAWDVLNGIMVVTMC
jgi:hypothetical protein